MFNKVNKINDRFESLENIILRLSDDIGKMADRIGEMSERILETQKIQTQNIELTQKSMMEVMNMMNMNGFL